ncbi:histidine kinase [Inquilinus sp. KBS0705]|nr:histidine kinase [Inquilinus sp. KBS0705]
MKYSKIEFWAANALFIISLLILLNHGLEQYGYIVSREHAVPNFIFNVLLPQVAIVLASYGAFMTVNFYAIPKLWARGKRVKAVVVIILVLKAMGLIFTVAQSYLASWIYQQYGNGLASNLTFLSRGFSMAITFYIAYGVYVLIREALIYQYKLQQARQTLRSKVIREVIITLSIWGVLFIPVWGFLMATNPGLSVIYVVGLPFCFIIYFVNLYALIPYYKSEKKVSGLVYFGLLMLLVIGAGFLEIMFLMAFAWRFSYMGYLVYVWAIPAVLTIGLSWRVYQANEDTYRQLVSLQSKLGASNANLQFLRSQINPHFLFNALNTLYGTALTEQAEKTGEGIQKLGDMMRFMLHENNQDSIPLSRDIEYLHNYIDLQNLRIALSDNIKIKADITDEYSDFNIAPMLLIPFIENAYKHGISFKQASWITVSLQVAGNVLQLDVYNSLHPEKDNDPERQRSGIGLENVKQRLQLLYPNRHELVIRQNTNEFFIHLTLHLS